MAHVQSVNLTVGKTTACSTRTRSLREVACTSPATIAIAVSNLQRAMVVPRPVSVAKPWRSRRHTRARVYGSLIGLPGIFLAGR